MEHVKKSANVFLHVQCDPAKTLRQLIEDRDGYSASLDAASPAFM